MKHLKAYLTILRIPNLVIIVLLQAVIYYGFIMPAFEVNGINSLFKGLQFPLFVFVTLIITGSGYVINDILDFNADRINKPQKMIVGKSLSFENAWRYYFILLTIGLIFAFWIAFGIGRPHYVVFYIMPVLILYYYSRSLKKSFLAGNLLISLFSAAVSGIMLFCEYGGLTKLKYFEPLVHERIIAIFAGIMVFSFFISLYREIVKDIEDAEGDRQIRARTIPILTGVEIAKAICGVLAIVILILLFYWIKLPFNSIEVRVYILIAIILPLSYSVWLLRKAKSMTDLSKLSNVIKLIMLTGIAMLFFYL